MKDRNTVFKLIFVISILLTAAVVATQGIVNGSVVLVIALIMMVNAGYGGGFSNIPTLLSDHYGMSNISAIHGITLSAWGFAGLTGNQLAAWIVSTFGEKVQLFDEAGNAVIYHGEEVWVNPTGYQMVLYVTLALYIVSLILSLFFVKKTQNTGEVPEH